MELFKENKLLKQDRSTLINYATSFFTDSEGKSQFQDPGIGQCVLEEMEKLSEQKINGFINKIQNLEKKMSSIAEEVKA